MTLPWVGRRVRSYTGRALAAAGVAAIGMWTFGSPPALAASVHTVRCGQVDGPHGLIAAIATANAAASPAVIELADCVYVLPTPAAPDDAIGPDGLPVITGSVTIDGNGATIRRAPAGPEFRILHVATGGTATLTDLTLTGGLSQTLGAGVLNDGTLSVRASHIVDNVSNGGGGGIGSRPGSRLDLDASVVAGNATPGTNDGGGIASGGALTITASTISDNSAGGSGGAVESFGTLQIGNTVISGNSAPQAGGLLDQSSATVVDTTFQANVADTTDGGALYLQGGSTATLQHVVLTDDRAVRAGGAVFVASPATLTMAASLVTANRAAQGGGISAAGGTVTTSDTVIVANLVDNCEPAGVVVGCAG